MAVKQKRISPPTTISPTPITIIGKFLYKPAVTVYKKGEFCHRRLVARWLEENEGIIVPEW